MHEILAKEFGDVPESVAQQIKGIKILDERDNQDAFTFAAGLQSLYGNLRQIGKFVRKHSNGDDHSKLLDTDALIEKKFIKGINGQS